MPDTVSKPVLDEELYALCVPQLLRSGRRFELAELARQRLLHMSSADHAGDWGRFFEGVGIDLAPPGRLERFYSFMVYLHAIHNGNGIGLGWARLTDDLVASHRLVLACERRVRTGRGYHCCIMPHAQHREDGMIFLTWLSGLR